MKTILFSGSVLRATPEEREARRPLARDPEAWHLMMEELESIAGWADANGIDALGMTEHHMQTEGGETMANSLLLYTKLAAQTERLAFMPLSLVLTARDPIRTAEDLAIFDHLHPGRLYGVGFARGYQTRWLQTMLQQEQVGAGPMDPVADATNRERFVEFLDIVDKAWREDSWSHEGAHYKVPFPPSGIRGWPLAEWTRRFGSPDEVDEEGTIHKIGVVPKPLRIPRIFIPVTFSPSTIELCAQRGYVPLVATSRGRLEGACELYQKTAAAAGRELGLGQGVGGNRKIVLGDSYEEAFEIAVRGAAYWSNNFFGLFGFQEGMRRPSDTSGFPLRFAEDRETVERLVDAGDIALGTPEMVCEDLKDVMSCYGHGSLEWLSWEFWGQGIPGDEGSDIARRQLELFGQQVLPEFG